jgi:hypothetical protein
MFAEATLAAKIKRREERALTRARRRMANLKEIAKIIIAEHHDDMHVDGQLFKLRVCYEPRCRAKDDWRDPHHQVMVRITQGHGKPRASPFSFAYNMDKDDSVFKTIFANSLNEAIAHIQSIRSVVDNHCGPDCDCNDECTMAMTMTMTKNCNLSESTPV